MIDCHVHLRDWELAQKETIKHGATIAQKAKFTALFDMPNTKPPLTNRKNILDRFKLAEKSLQGLNIFYGIYGGITSNFTQIEEIVKCYNEFFPKLVGFKMFAGHSTGKMGIIEKEEQRVVYKELAKLNYKGVIAIHCEKESLMNATIFNLKNPETHSIARPSIAEVESIKDQIELVQTEKFLGHIHICHISTSEGVKLVNEAKQNGINISCGATAHHSLLNTDTYKKLGLLAKMNPPLRNEDDRKAIFTGLISGDIDCIESDHAPHTVQDKNKGASGVPGFAGSLLLIQKLRKAGCSEPRLQEICGKAINSIYGLNLKFNVPCEQDIKKALPYLRSNYPFDVFSNISI